MSLAWLLVFLSILPIVAQGGLDRCDQLNRTSWLLFGCLLTVILTTPNRWAAAGMACIAAGLLTVVPRSDVWLRSGLPALAAASAYAVLTPRAVVSWVEPVLWAFVAVGCYMGLWTDYSRQQGLKAYQRWWPTQPRLGHWLRPICWHEDSPTHLKAGQGNANHLQSCAALATAAVGALVLLGRPWALLAWPLVLQPMLRRITKEHWLGQGHLHLATAAVGALGIWSGNGWLLMLLLGLYASLGSVLVKPWRPRTDALDGGRFGMWRTVLTEGWWPASWRQRLLGFGTGTWQAISAPLTMAKHGGVIFTAAHNEAIQWLVEHGLIGFVIFVGYFCDLSSRLWHGGPSGHALLLLAIVLGSVAMTNFPWTFFHQIARPPECATCNKPVVARPGEPRHVMECQCPIPWSRPVENYYVGSPALNAMSLVLAILAEAF